MTNNVQTPKPQAPTTIVCDVWGGWGSQDHVARYILPLSEAFEWAKQELEAGFLVNMRAETVFGVEENFDLRKKNS